MKIHIPAFKAMAVCNQHLDHEAFDVEIPEECLEAAGYVRVVRCKDCAWYGPNNDGHWIGCAFDTRHPADIPKDNDFCSYGERKDNG